MLRVLKEAVIIVVETVLVLAVVAAFGVPGGKSPKATAVSPTSGICGQTSDCLPMPAYGDWSGENLPGR